MSETTGSQPRESGADAILDDKGIPFENPLSSDECPKLNMMYHHAKSLETRLSESEAARGIWRDAHEKASAAVVAWREMSERWKNWADHYPDCGYENDDNTVCDCGHSTRKRQHNDTIANTLEHIRPGELVLFPPPDGVKA